MNRLRNFLTGTSGDGDGHPDAGGHRNHPRGSNYGYNSNSNDDYLSDDDDWGMSATRVIDQYGRRRTKQQGLKAFWDQSAMDGGGGGGGYSSSGRGAGGVVDVELPSKNGKWERQEAAHNDFEIGDANYFHSETSGRRGGPQQHRGIPFPPPPPRPQGGGNGEGRDAYTDVDDDISQLEESDHSVSSSASKEEGIMNAYRAYLKSIREGGFESYLEETNDGDEPDHPQGAVAGGAERDDDEALERVLNIEEERASGSLYEDLYGVHDVRSPSSPYAAWRAKAKALVRQDEEREIYDESSPSRQMLKRYRKNRDINNIVNGGERNGRSGYSDRLGGDDDEEQSYMQQKLYRYRMLCERQGFRGTCIGLSLLILVIVGLSHYGGQSSNPDNEEDVNPDDIMTLPGPPTASNGDTGMMETSHVYGGPTSNSQNQVHQGPSDAILNALGTFDPVWYDRRSGWNGITFKDGVDFCHSHENRVPCPYEIYCNEGTTGPPYRGMRPNGEQWSPISNGANQFVSVGNMFTCRRYTDLHDNKKPDWGITGISEEHEHGAGGITQNIMCCVDLYKIGTLDPFTEWSKQDNEIGEHTLGDDTEETIDEAVVNLADGKNEREPNSGVVATIGKSASLDAQKREKAVIAAFQPIWFSTAHGWSGGSYEAAIAFCESYNHMVLCPYAAYCPNGNSQPPLPGSMINAELDGEEWAPANGPMNTWLQIGMIDGMESTQCTLHHDLLGERPQWGVDGSRTEVKHHILCCLM